MTDRNVITYLRTVLRFDNLLTLMLLWWKCQNSRVCMCVRYVVFDTPGQIEVFTWSASGTIITEALVHI